MDKIIWTNLNLLKLFCICPGLWRVGIEEACAFGNHGEKSFSRVNVFFVLFEVFCQFINFGGKQCYLDFRTRCVSGLGGVFFDDLLFLIALESHVVSIQYLVLCI